MIRVENLVKSYSKGEPAVKAVTFNINKGEIVGLLGPNGAGKSTIMKMLTGFLAPTAGKITIDGKDILDDPLEIKKLIGYMPENTPSYGDMTVYEYLSFIANIRGIKDERIEESILKVVKITAVEDVVTKKIKQLSRGYQKRIYLASVMIHEPQILILDEPTSGLDPNQVIAFRKIVRKLSRQKTVIISTHVLSEIEATCERVIIIKKGSIVADNTIQNLIKENSDDEYIEFSIEAENLEDIELEFAKIKEAWKIEFTKKEAKNKFRFMALTRKNSSFEEKLKETVKNNSWKLNNYQKNNVNLEELFIKYVGEDF